MSQPWLNEIGVEFNKPYMRQLSTFLKERRAVSKVYPEKEDVFNALKLTSYEDTRVVIIGQDPYHNGQAHGLSFSVKVGSLPPSLRRIYDSIGMEGTGDLTNWATQGVLMLNTVLTVEHGLPFSHNKMGWEQFTSQIVKVLTDKPVVFVLFGAHAKTQYKNLITSPAKVIYREHPVAGVYQGRPWNHLNWYEEVNSHLKTPIQWKNQVKQDTQKS
jgi:uracil-DNA glycosylase